MADVSLTAAVDTSGVATGMAAIRNEVGRVGTSIESMFSGLLSPAALISTALSVGLKGLIDYGSRIQDLSDRFKRGTTGLTTELQQFGVIAEENGSSLEGLAKGFNRLSVALSQARSGSGDMQRTLERLGITNWEDKSLKLSDAVLQVGTSSMEAADMVKVFGREGTSLAETFRFAAENAGKLGKAISPEMIKKLDDLDDRWKRTWANARADTANTIGGLEGVNAWLDKILSKVGLGGLRIDFSKGSPQVFNDQFQPGGGGFGGRGAGSDFGATGQQIPPDDNAVARMDQYLEANQLVEQTLDKEYQLWLAMLSPQEQLVELQNQRVALEQELTQAVQYEGEGSDRVWEIRGQIADIIRETIPLQTQIADEQARAADEAARQADEEARVREESQRTADETKRRNDKAERDRIAALAGPSPLTIGYMAEHGITLGATSNVYAAALAASRGIQPGSPEYNRLVMEIAAKDKLREMQGRNLGWQEQLNRDRLVQWYSARQAQQGLQQSQQQNQQQMDYWKAIAAGRMPSTGNPYLGLFGTPDFMTGQFNPTTQPSSTEAIGKLQSQIDLLGKVVTSLQQIQKNTEIVQIP
jgi:hypothetical protein